MIITQLIGTQDSCYHYKSDNIDMPKSITNYLNQTPIFEWYVIRCGFRNGYQRDMCIKEINPCAQFIITILGSHNQHKGERKGSPI